jgi:hypothetical protein
MNLNRMAADIGVGGLGIASPSPLGVLGAAWPQPPGTSSQHAAHESAHCVIAIAVRIQYSLDSLLQGEISIQKTIRILKCVS